MYLALIETNGNQAYIFGTSRLRDQVGASWLLTRLPEWFREVSQGYDGVRPVLEVSGKVIFTCEQEETAKEIIRGVCEQALTKGAGMDVSGAYIEVSSQNLTGEDFKNVHAEVANYNASRRPVQARFMNQPIFDICPDSGLPASRHEDTKDGKRAISQACAIRRKHASEFRKYLLTLAKGIDPDTDERLVDLEGFNDAYGYTLTEADFEGMVTNIEDLENSLQGDSENERESGLEWVGVICADANGLGAVFTKLQETYDDLKQQSEAPELGSVEEFYREASKAVAKCTKEAFVNAWWTIAGEVKKQDEDRKVVIPLIPVLLGGDDVCVISDGGYALAFAEHFANFYEQATGEDPLLRYIVKDRREAGLDGLSVGVGVAIVKPNFPFFDAHHLADELCSSAKKLSRLTSCMDFHVLFDSQAIPLSQLREKAGHMYLRPLFYTLPPELEELLPDECAPSPLLWSTVKYRTWLFEGVSGSTPISRSQANRMRQLISKIPPSGVGSPEYREAQAHWRQICDTNEDAEAVGFHEAGLLVWPAPLLWSANPDNPEECPQYWKDSVGLEHLHRSNRVVSLIMDLINIGEITHPVALGETRWDPFYFNAEEDSDPEEEE